MDEENYGCIGIVVFILIFWWLISNHSDKVRTEAYNNGQESGYDDGYADGYDDGYADGLLKLK